MIKSLTEMTKEELREAIKDPIGPDYKAYREAAQWELWKRTKDA